MGFLRFFLLPLPSLVITNFFLFECSTYRGFTSSKFSQISYEIYSISPFSCLIGKLLLYSISFPALLCDFDTICGRKNTQITYAKLCMSSKRERCSHVKSDYTGRLALFFIILKQPVGMGWEVQLYLYLRSYSPFWNRLFFFGTLRNG